MWRMALIGMPEFEAYTLEHPGASRFELSCQGSELLIGLAKLFCCKCGTGKWDMSEKLSNYLDITGTCMVHNNQVDFHKILRRLEKEKILIFDPQKTPLVEIALEDRMAPLMKFIVDILNTWEIGDPIHPFLKQIMNALTLDVNALSVQKIEQIMMNSIEYENDNIDIWGEEYDETLAEMQRLNDNFLKKPSLKSSMRVAAAVVNNQL